MGSEGDAREKDSGHEGSEFGPPLGEFGAPVADAGRRAPVDDDSSEFGPSLSEFGPPVAGFGGPVGAEGSAPQWSAETTGDHPELVWRPATEPETTPPPIPQYRAPDNSVFPETSSQPRYPVQPKPPEPEQDQWWTTSSESALPPTPPVSTPHRPGLSWDDDPIARRLAPGAPVPPPRSTEGGSGRRFALIGAATVALVAVIAAAVVFATRDSGGGDPEPTAAPPPPTASCVSKTEGDVTTGNGPGDTASGIGTILAFNYATYTARNGALARTLATPDANVKPTDEEQQREIDELVPVGTTYCLKITTLASDLYYLVAQVSSPGKTEYAYRQQITVVNQDGRYLIKAILPIP